MSKHGEVLATVTEEHRAVERSNAEIAIGTQNTGGRAFSAHTRAPADRSATLKSFTISILDGCLTLFGERERPN